MAMFSRYKKSDDKLRVQLIYLILNGYDLSKVEVVTETVEKKLFGTEYRKIYGVTNEFVDVQKIEEELARIQIPMVCSPQSFDIYSTSKVIHSYRAKEPSKPLYINDMGVISSLMIISEQCIVSSNLAETVENAEAKGFMHFVDYVLHGKCEVGNWKISYKDKEFCIYYTSENGKKKNTELLYQAIELDQTATYRLVLYIIQKVTEMIDEFPPDNFAEETWERMNE